jgi:hypothetical protein
MEHHPDDPRPLYLDYELTLRSHERMRTRHWHPAWLLREDVMLKTLSDDRVHAFDATQFQDVLSTRCSAIADAAT